MRASISANCSDIYFLSKKYKNKAGEDRTFEGWNIELFNPEFSSQYDRLLTLVMDKENGDKADLGKQKMNYVNKKVKVTCNLTQYQNTIRLTPVMLELEK